MFDAEVRTACRRLLARVALVGPEAFRRRAGVAISAAAVIWMIGKVNDVFDIYRRGKQVKDLANYLGVTGVSSQRAEVMLKAAGFDSGTVGLTLGSPDYLVSTRRKRMIQARDRDLEDDVIDLDR